MWADKDLRTQLALAVISILASAVSGRCSNHEVGAIVLRGAVETHHTQVFLADLLPAGAALELIAVSAQVEVCRAPQPGSIRILRREFIEQRIGDRQNLQSALTIPPEVSVRYSGWPISGGVITKTVADFLNAKAGRYRLPGSAQLEWPNSLVSSQEQFSLQVTATNWDYRGKALQFRMRCSEAAACGSFVVRVILPASVFHDIRLPGSPTLVPITQDGKPMASPGDGPILVVRGKAATLVLDDASTRIAIPVICLEPGRLHERIKVLDRQSRQVSRVEVIGSALVHGSL